MFKLKELSQLIGAAVDIAYQNGSFETQSVTESDSEGDTDSDDDLDACVDPEYKFEDDADSDGALVADYKF